MSEEVSMGATFTFNTTPSIISGAGSCTGAGETLLLTLGQRVLLVTDKGLLKLGVLQPLLDSMLTVGIQVTIFNEVEADPPEHNVLSAVQLAARISATGVIGVGGGSPMDVAKVVALLQGSKQPIGEVYGVGVARGPRLPLALIPTTAGTGSEVTPIAILTMGEAQKKGIISPYLLPDVAILDAELTVGLPRATTAATGIDAMVHAIEAFTSASPSNNPISRGLARQALQLLGANISKATFNGTDRGAREGMLLGAMLAGQAFANSPVAAVHALAYPIGARFHVPHGLSNALVLPHVMRFNLAEVPASYGELSTDVFPELSKLDVARRGQAFIDSLVAMIQELGLPSRLRDAGIPRSSLELLAKDAMKQTRLLVNNPRELKESDALAIYEAAF
ncbi:iron-containing alcohol dehydrogenase [Paraburkholderia sp. SIMBA_049]